MAVLFLMCWPCWIEVSRWPDCRVPRSSFLAFWGGKVGGRGVGFMYIFESLGFDGPAREEVFVCEQ